MPQDNTTIATPLTGSDSYDSFTAALKKQGMSDAVDKARSQLNTPKPPSLVQRGLSLLGFAAGTSDVPSHNMLADAVASRAAGPPLGAQPARTGFTLFGGSGGAYPGGTTRAPAPVPVGQLFDDGGQTGPKAPSPTDVATAQSAPVAPATPSAAAALTAAGHAADSHATGETHPATHTLEQFVQSNKHLTPRDLQVLAAYLPPVLSPHDQALDTLVKGRNTQLQKSLAGLTDQNDVSGSMRQKVLDQYETAMKPYLVGNPLNSVLGNLIGGQMGAGMPTP